MREEDGWTCFVDLEPCNNLDKDFVRSEIIHARVFKDAEMVLWAFVSVKRRGLAMDEEYTGRCWTSYGCRAGGYSYP